MVGKIQAGAKPSMRRSGGTGGPSRRQVLKGGAAAAVAVATAGALSAPAIVRAQGGTLRVRRNASTMASTDSFFTDYGEAVKAMHDLQASDPTDQRTWRNQSLIHLGHCPHGLDDFFAWHRNYITFYEEICGKLIGKPDFALAYWDWTEIRGRLPAPFFSNDYLNVTYWKDPSNAQSNNWSPVEVRTVGTRALTPTVGLQDRDTGGNFTAANIAQILKLGPFNDFWHAVETGPHNTGHVLTGGSNGHMSNGMSPLDPIFWLHHCNVDRLWAEWQTVGNTMPSQPQVYNGQFVNADGRSVDATAAAAVDFRAMGFTYETLVAPAVAAAPSEKGVMSLAEAPVDPAAPAVLLASGPGGPTASIGRPASIAVAATGLAEGLFGTRAFFPSENKTLSADQRRVALEPSRTLLRLSEITVTGAATQAVVNVYVNTPGVTPSDGYGVPGYAGSFSYFMPPVEGSHAAMQAFTVDATDALRHLAEAGRLDPNDLTVQLLPLPVQPEADPPEMSITVGKIEVLRL
ncbi:MAG: tyrosinase family protein [Alphaproteobacteria bacterium]|nr:tyrosinase family protein [Alphaproteobacteria bacterium]